MPVVKEETVVLDGDWWSSWRRWPAEPVAPDVLLAAADWCADLLVCECSRARFKSLSEGERRGMVSVFSGWLADGVGRSMFLASGRRVFVVMRRCLGERCGRVELVRVEVAWRG